MGVTDSTDYIDPTDVAGVNDCIRARAVEDEALRPIDIKVHGDFAVVHYFYVEVLVDADGEETTEKGRWTDVLMKQNGKWVWIADHGGSTSDE